MKEKPEEEEDLESEGEKEYLIKEIVHRWEDIESGKVLYLVAWEPCKENDFNPRELSMVDHSAVKGTKFLWEFERVHGKPIGMEMEKKKTPTPARAVVVRKDTTLAAHVKDSGSECEEEELEEKNPRTPKWTR